MSLLMEKYSPSFLLSSKDKINRNDSNSSFQAIVNLKQNSTYDRCAVSYIGIPYSFYNINANNNTMTITQNTVETVITFGDGYLNLTNIESYLQGKLNAIGGTYPWTYTVSIDSFTNKINIDIVGHVSRVITEASIDFTGHASNTIFGFPENVSYPFTIVGNTASMEAPQPFHLQPTQYITVRSNLIENRGSGSHDLNILARIPFKNVGFGEMIHYEPSLIDDVSHQLNSGNDNVFSFSLYDDNDNLIDLNNRNWFINIYVYESDKLPNQQLTEIDYTRKQRQLQRERAQFEELQQSLKK